MQITKVEGVLIAPIVIFAHLLPYWYYIHGTQYTAHLIGLFAVGVFVSFLHKIEIGTKARLCFNDKGTDTYWQDGWSIVPSLLPILRILLNMHLLWWLDKPVTERERLGIDGAAELHHHVDQRELAYRVNVNTSLLTAQVTRISGNVFNWYFDIHRGDPNLLCQRLSTRIIILALILGTGANIFFPINKSNRPSWVKFFTGENKSTVEVFVNLAKGDKPTMPEDEYFTVNATDTWSCPETAKRMYCRYRNIEDKIPAIPVEESLCVAVPVGKMIAFKTGRRPVYVINMENRVSYEKKIERFQLQDRIKVLVSELRNPMKPPYSARATWEALYEDWGAVDTSNVVIARALPYDKIPDGRALGGLVCF